MTGRADDRGSGPAGPPTAPAAPGSPGPEPTPPEPASPTSAQRWRRLPLGARALLLVAAAVVGVNAGLAGLESVTGGSEPGGAPSSSFATAPEGVAGFADLLEARGHTVGRVRTALHRADLDPRTTLVVADAPRLSAAETRALDRFVADGGRLLVAGRSAGTIAGVVLGDGPAWTPRPATPARPLAPAPEVAGVSTVVTAGRGSFAGTGPVLPVLAGPEGVLAGVASSGRGRIVTVADSSFLHNRLLARADNAAFGLAAVGPQGRPVRFAEAHHGYGSGRGFAALPARWRWSMAGGVVAVLVWMWSRGRRLGPPEDLERPLPPARRAYADAVAATLSRTRRPAESMAPLQAAARRRLEQVGGLPADAGRDELERAAGRAGLAPGDLAALLRPVGSDADTMAAGRALAHLESGAR